MSQPAFSEVRVCLLILSFRLPRLTVSAPKLEMEKSGDSMSDHLSAPNLYTTTMTEFVASFAIVQLLLRSTDAVLGKVG